MQKEGKKEEFASIHEMMLSDQEYFTRFFGMTP